MKPLHPDSALIHLKLAEINQKSTEELVCSLALGQKHCLKTRPDGTILDGHHHLYILRTRGVNIDELPREIMERETEIGIVEA